jgi:hypothetical protein
VIGKVTMFAALHESAHGTKQTYRHDLLFVRFRGEADMPRASGACRSGGFDPKRTSANGRNWATPPLRFRTIQIFLQDQRRQAGIRIADFTLLRIGTFLSPALARASASDPCAVYDCLSVQPLRHCPERSSPIAVQSCGAECISYGRQRSSAREDSPAVQMPSSPPPAVQSVRAQTD